MQIWNRIILIGFAAWMASMASRAAAQSSPAEVVDGGAFFSADAVTQASQRLASIAQNTGRDLRIETYSRIPDELRGRYSPDQKALFFANWADQRARRAGVRGMMVLINRDPAFITVQLGRQTRQSGAITDSDRNRVRDAMVTAFRAKHDDQGLTDAVNLFSQMVEKAPMANPPPAPSASSNGGASVPGAPPPAYRLPPSNSPASANPPPANSSPAPPTGGRTGSIFGCGSLLFWGILILCGIWLLRRIFRRRGSYQNPYGGGYGAGPNPPNYPTGQYPPTSGSGGGFGRGFGGGILGGLLGGLLGGRMSRGGSTPVPPPPDNSGGGWNEPPPPPQEFGGGGDPSGGASFGDSSADDGGADFGGSDDAGGGGDFGSGGDSSGGGSF